MPVRLIWLIPCLIIFSLPEGTHGCRYNVRETGFVDAGVQPFIVVCLVDERTPRSFGERFLREAEAVLKESNITFELVDVDQQPDHPALSYVGDLSQQLLPQLILVSPERSLSSDPVELGDDQSPERLIGELDEIVSSPFREELVKLMAKHYGVVLLVEGSNDVQNQLRREAVQKTLNRIKRQMKFMPKPISHGPELITLGPDDQPAEKLLLWSLGINEIPSSEPYAAVLYGKARWLGPLLRNTEIEEEKLTQLLSIIGADCECGLDPRLMRGRPFPVKWDRKVHSKVVEDLGFDPENPMVRIEVSQIMRMRASLYPERFAELSRTGGDDLPVPFVDDSDSSEAAFDLRDPVTINVLWSVLGVGALAIVAGLLMMKKANGKKS
jgi:hypothetical protein